MREDNGGVLMLQQDELRSHGYFDVIKRRKWVILQALVLVPVADEWAAPASDAPAAPEADGRWGTWVDVIHS